jgi:outer membrane protein OmpA-like peptidoglycan-associated protein
MRPLFLPILAGALLAACGPKPVVTAPARPGQALVALLPDADTGMTGRAIVSSTVGTADLDRERASTLATTDHGPGPVKTLSQADVDQLFGDALAALPPPPAHYTLYFKFESDELTEESRALIDEILQAVRGRTAPEVAIVGHTDTMGAAAANVELGLKRAMMVRARLVEAGLDPATIEVTSHGEGDPLVRTPDDTAEPRNRRVEISVK